MDDLDKKVSTDVVETIQKEKITEIFIKNAFPRMYGTDRKGREQFFIFAFTSNFSDFFQNFDKKK